MRYTSSIHEETDEEPKNGQMTHTIFLMNTIREVGLERGVRRRRGHDIAVPGGAFDREVRGVIHRFGLYRASGNTFGWHESSRCLDYMKYLSETWTMEITKYEYISCSRYLMYAPSPTQLSPGWSPSFLPVNTNDDAHEHTYTSI